MEGARQPEQSEGIFRRGGLETMAQYFADALKEAKRAAGETFDPQKIDEWVLNAMVEAQTKAKAENRELEDEDLIYAAADALYPDLVNGEKVPSNKAKKRALLQSIMAKHEQRPPGIGREFPQ